MVLDGDFDGHPIYASRPSSSTYQDADQESNDSNDDVKFVNGKPNYIIPEDEDDAESGLITNETNV